jgi:hypothetical protein
MSRTKYKNVKIFNCICIYDEHNDNNEYNYDDVIIIDVYVTDYLYDIVRTVLTKNNHQQETKRILVKFDIKYHETKKLKYMNKIFKS